VGSEIARQFAFERKRWPKTNRKLSGCETSGHKHVQGAAAGHSASAAEIKLDFDSLIANSILSQATVGTSVFDVFSGGNAPNIFDTVDGSFSDHVGDPDIIPAVQGENGVAGKVLIIQSPKDGGGKANDFAGGGRITFTLSSGPSLSFIGASAIDDGTFLFGTQVDGDLGVLSFGSENETGKISFMSTALNVGDSFYIDFFGSGAVDALVFDDGVTPVPVPASLPLLVGALGGIGLMSRRKAKKT
jgi:hypothetical protein